MKLLTPILLLITTQIVLSMNNVNGDLDTSAGVNFQLLYSQKQQELNTREKECTQRINELTMQLEGIRAQVVKNTEANQVHNKDNKTLTAELEKCVQNLGSIDTLNVQITNLNTANNDLMAKNKQLDGDHKKLVWLILDKTTEINTLNNSLIKSNQQGQYLYQRIETNFEVMENFKAKINQLNALIQQLAINKENNQNIISDNEDIRKELILSDNARKELEAKNQALLDLISQLKTELSAKNNIETYARTLEDREKQCMSQNIKLTYSVNELNIAVQKNANENNNRVQDMNAQLNNLKIVFDTINRENQELKTNILSLRTLNNDLNNKIKVVDAYSKTIDAQNKQIVQLDQQNMTLKFQLDKASDFMNNCRNIENENKILLRQIYTLNVRITETTKIYSDCEKKSKDFENLSQKLFTDLNMIKNKTISQKPNADTNILIGSSTKFDF